MLSVQEREFGRSGGEKGGGGEHRQCEKKFLSSKACLNYSKFA